MPIIKTFILTVVGVLPFMLFSSEDYQSNPMGVSGPEENKIDTAYISLLINQGVEYIEIDFDISVSYLERAIDLINEYQSQDPGKEFSEKLLLQEAQALNKLAFFNLEWGHDDRALELYTRVLPIWETIESDDNVANSYIHIGNIYYFESKYPEALQAYSTGLAVAKEANITERIANFLMNIGNVYYYMSDYSASMEFFQKAISTYQQMGSPINMAYAYLGMGNVYSEMGRVEQALESYNKTLEIQQMHNAPQNKESVYLSIGSLYYDSDDFSKAREYYLLALEMAKENNNTYTQAQCYENIGIIHAANQQYEKAIQYYNEALEISKAQSFDLITVSSLHNKSISLIKTGNANQALAIAKESLELSRELSLFSHETETYRVIAEIYKTQKNFEQALSFFETYKAYNDSLFNLEKQRQINEIDANFQLTQKQQEIDIQNLEIEKNRAEIRRKNLLVNFFVIVSVFVIIMAFSYIWYYNHKKQKTKEITRYLKNITNLSKNILKLEKDLSSQKLLLNELRKSQELAIENDKNNLEFAFRLNNELASGINSMRLNLPGKYFAYCDDIQKADLCFFHKTKDYALLVVADLLMNPLRKAIFNLSLNYYLAQRANMKCLQSIVAEFSTLTDFLETQINNSAEDQPQNILTGIAMLCIDYSTYKIRFLSRNIPFYFAIARNNESIFKPLCDYQEIQQPTVAFESTDKNKSSHSYKLRDYEIKLKKQDRIYLINTSALDFEKNDLNLRESVDSFVIHILDTHQNMEIDHQGEYLSRELRKKNQSKPRLYPDHFTIRALEL
jgi:tetratricopeptide (TPR) repeat protein